MVGSLGGPEIRSGVIAYPLDDLALRVSLPGALPLPKLGIERALARRLPLVGDTVEKRFCGPARARLIQDEPRMRNIDSRDQSA